MAVLVKCKDHPKYQAIRRPRAGCGTCELLWDLKNGSSVENESSVWPRVFSSLVRG